MNRRRKSCLVGGCRNTSENSSKRFLSIPKKQDRRNAWFEAIKVTHVRWDSTSTFYICEDHFNLEEDAANWQRIKLLNNQNVMLKPGVVPHLLIKDPRKARGGKTNRPQRTRRTDTAPAEETDDDTDPDDACLEEDPLSLVAVESGNVEDADDSMAQNLISGSESPTSHIMPYVNIVPSPELTTASNALVEVKSEVTQDVWIKDDPASSPPESENWEEESPAQRVSENECLIKESQEPAPPESGVIFEVVEPMYSITTAAAETEAEQFWRSRAELLEEENKMLGTKIMSMQAIIDDLQNKLEKRDTAKLGGWIIV